MGRYSSRTLDVAQHRLQHAESRAEYTRPALQPPRRDHAILIRQQAERQRRFVELAQAVAVFGSGDETGKKLEALRAEIALVERDLVLVANSA